MLTEREETFEANLSALGQADEQSFRNRYAELRRFFDEAVRLGEPIDCSL